MTWASPATAAAWAKVEWPVSAARWTSSSAKLASWISSSASAAAATVAGEGAVSPVRTIVRPGARGSHHLLGRDRAVGALDLLPPLQRREGRAFPHPGGDRRGGIEAAGALGLDQRVAVGAGAVGGLEGLDLVVVVLDRLAGGQLDQLEAEAEPADQRLQDSEELLQTRRPVDDERPLAVGQVIGLQQPRQAEDVVGVEVGQVDRVDLGQPDRALHLPLRPFAAVEQQPVSPTRDQHARGRAPRRRHRAARAEKDHRKIHGAEPTR